MKKSSIAIAVTVVIMAIIGVVYLSNSNNIKNLNIGGLSKVKDTSEGDSMVSSIQNTASGEYNHTLQGDDKITVEYLKTGDIVKIYALYPVDNKDKYDILLNGTTAAYAGKDGHIWVFYSNGTHQKVTPDKYENIEKSSVAKNNPGYIWADKPEFTGDGKIRFVSNLPDTSDNPQKSLWQVDIKSGAMTKIYTPLSENYRVLGTRGDGKLMVEDGDSLAVIDTASASFENIDLKGRFIISMSPDGSKILCADRGNDGKPNYNELFIIDGTGKKLMDIPKMSGYAMLGTGQWYSDSSRYGYIARPAAGGKDKIAVISFDEESVHMDSFFIETDIKIPETSKVKWTADNAILVDIGDDVITVELH